MKKNQERTAEVYKKLLEKVEWFSFQMKLDGEKYSHVLYQRFNNPSGILIVDESGKAVSKELAKKIVAPMNYYNNIAKGAAADLVREKDRDVTPMKDLQRILNENASFLSTSSCAEAYNEVVRMLKIILDGQQALTRIFEELKSIDIESREKKKYITMEDTERFLSLNEQYQTILFRQGKAQVETRSSMDSLIECMKDSATLIQESDRAIEVLITFQDSKIKRTLDESLKSFEEDKHGKRHSLSSNEVGVSEMLVLYKDKTRNETKKNLYKLIRNE